jgi:hypothetical protein
MSTDLHVTRIAHSCHLIEIGLLYNERGWLPAIVQVLADVGLTRRARAGRPGPAVRLP